MKNIALLLGILFIGFSANAIPLKSEDNFRRGYDGSAYIFVEGGVEFSVFPDGQFDFVYLGPQTGKQIIIHTPNVNISFNSGYDYETFVQYDDYGAVIQIENVPIYYDHYGRIIQAGSVDIRYNDRRIVRIGGLYIYYNPYGYFSHYSGVINIYNPYYVYRPWHVYYARPIFARCIVYDLPYRRNYTPVRYSYTQHLVRYKNRNNVAYNNARRDFYRPGSRVYDNRGRASINRNFDPNRINTMVTATNTRANSTGRNNTSNSVVRTNPNTRTNPVRNSGAATVDRNVRNTGNQSSINRTKNTQTANPVRTTNTRTVSNNRTVHTPTRNVTIPNRSTSVTRSTTSTPQRQTSVRRNITNKSNAASSNSRGNALRSNTVNGRG